MRNENMWLYALTPPPTNKPKYTKVSRPIYSDPTEIRRFPAWWLFVAFPWPIQFCHCFCSCSMKRKLYIWKKALLLTVTALVVVSWMALNGGRICVEYSWVKELFRPAPPNPSGRRGWCVVWWCLRMWLTLDVQNVAATKSAKAELSFRIWGLRFGWCCCALMVLFGSGVHRYLCYISKSGTGIKMLPLAKQICQNKSTKWSSSDTFCHL